MMTKLPQCHRNIINYCPTMNKVIFMFKVPTFFSQLWALKCLLRNLWLKTACSYFSLLWFLHQQFCVSAILCHIQVICMIFFFFSNFLCLFLLRGPGGRELWAAVHLAPWDQSLSREQCCLETGPEETRRWVEGCSSVLSGPSKEQSPEHFDPSEPDVDIMTALSVIDQHTHTHTLILCSHMDSMVCRVKQ